jgi:hypothetical protein
LGHGPPDNGGHERIAAASSILGLTSANAQDQQCYRSLRYFHTAEATGSKPVTPLIVSAGEPLKLASHRRMGMDALPSEA